MGQSLELREMNAGRSQKISVGSLSTDMTDAFSESEVIGVCTERELVTRRQRSEGRKWLSL